MPPVQETIPGKYFYCIIRCPEPHEFKTRGIGEQGAIVNTINYKDLAAVVSDSPVVEYDNSRRNMMAHSAVLDEVMQEFNILPVRFGIVAPDSKSIMEQMLQRRYAEFDKLLRKMDGKAELGLKAFWYEDVVYREIVESNSAISHLRNSLVGRSPEETYYERIKLGELVEMAMNKLREDDVEHITRALKPLAHETRFNAVITERMVLNAAFLVDRTREPEFDQAIQQLDAEMGKRLIFKYVGSAPPYNFVNIIVRWDK
ncbi:GvpL/GvpF family gas vesicle protein [Chloroflexales bacterium ZM16-3]|nr:GvpL/GvpF family gas vesicle protein [Chloroflexales bacterium ZM16-3]